MPAFTTVDAYMMADALGRIARYLAAGQSWLAVETIADCIDDVPALAMTMDANQLRAALTDGGDLAPRRHTEASER